MTVVQVLQGTPLSYSVVAGNSATASVPAPYVVLRFDVDTSAGFALAASGLASIGPATTQLDSAAPLIVPASEPVVLGTTLHTWSDGANSASLSIEPLPGHDAYFQACWSYQLAQVQRKVCHLYLQVDGSFRGVIVDDASRGSGTSRTWASWN